MKIELRIEGGFGFFPGLQKPVILLSQNLSKEDQATLLNLIHKNEFLDFSDEKPRNNSKSADKRIYRITIKDDSKTSHFSAIEPI
jgi:hypothetical protein